MATTTMNISLPDSMKTFIDETLAVEGYGSASEYMRELIRADQKKREKDEVEKLLLKRLRSKKSASFTIDDVRSELSRKQKAKR